MFNEINIDNRLRHAVRGRVIVFTNSSSVEYIDEDLTRSYPLYYGGYIEPGFGLAFCVELNGFLTFDEGCEVRMIEVGPFVSAYYDPKAFSIIRPADPVPSHFSSINPTQYGTFFYAGFALDQEFGFSAGYRCLTPFNTIAEAEAFGNSLFVLGEVFKGVKGYPPHKFLKTY